MDSLLAAFYIILCFVQMAILTGALVVAHRIQATSSASLVQTTRLDANLQAVSALHRLADGAAPPTDARIASSEWMLVSTRILRGGQAFLEQADHRMHTAAFHKNRAKMEQAAREMREMVVQTEEAGQALRGKRLAVFHQKLDNARQCYTAAQSELASISESTYQRKSELLDRQLRASARLRYFLLILAISGLLLIVPIIAYAWLLYWRGKEYRKSFLCKQEALEQIVAERTSELCAEMRRREKSDALAAGMMESNLFGVALWHLDGHITEPNDAFLQMLGYSHEDVAAGLSMADITPAEFEGRDQQAIRELCTTGEARPYEKEYVRKDGSRVPVMVVRGRSVDDEALMLVFDLTERKKAQQKLALMARIVETAAEAIVITDPEGQIQWANASFTELTGYTVQEAVGKNPRVLKSGKMDPAFYSEMWSTIRAGNIFRGQLVNRRKDGTLYTEEMIISPVRASGDEITHFVAFKQDISERKQAEERARYLAYYDALTDLPNRALLQDRLTQALAAATRRKEKLALLFLDIDHFKTINDSLGHTVGDALLREIARRLKLICRKQDTVARLGGDEFVIMISGVRDPVDATRVAQKILTAIGKKMVIAEHALSITGSIGLSLFPDHGTDCDTLLKHADSAMYCRKDAGRNGLQFFTGEMNDRANMHLAIQNNLRFALERNEFYLVYQPQVDGHGKITGAEALLRWRHPQMGIISPHTFIPIAEDSGHIVSIGNWVLRTACQQASQWQHKGLPPLPIAVNVSAVQLRDPHFVDMVIKTLDELSFPPECLELEITERTMIRNEDNLESVLVALRGIGVSIALDDFGTGYSCLSYLQRLPVDRLKIDRSFVSLVTTSPHNASITETIIQLARNLQLKVIAEGVENEEQWQFLEAKGCDSYQGFLFSPPISPEEFFAKATSSQLLTRSPGEIYRTAWRGTGI